MPNTVVSILAKDATGAALPNATFAFTPLDHRLRGVDGAVIVGTVIRVITDAGGAASVTLKPGIYQYRTVSDIGESIGAIAVPEAATALLSDLLNVPDSVYQTVGWAEYQALIVATAMPYADVAAGLAAVSEAGLFVVALAEKLAVFRDVAGVAVPVFIET